MKTKVLMVCLGNICRSPLAEGILTSKVDPKRVFVDSAGTAGYHVGNPPDGRSVAVARKNGLEIAHHRCRKVVVRDFREFDLIYAMDSKNLEDLLKMAPGPKEAQKVKLLLEEADLDFVEVPDPYYGTSKDFEKVYEMIDKACGAIVKNLI